MNILQVCAYAAEYEGNFMKSLYSLEQNLNDLGHNVFYAFPENAKDKLWCVELQKRTKVFFLPLRMARIRPSTYLRLMRIIKNNNIKIVHSHFELYDIPCNIMSKKEVKVVWHIHDAIENLYSKASISRKFLFRIQYSLMSNNTNIISVSRKHLEFVKNIGLESKSNTVILNGTDLSRIKKIDINSEKVFDFVFFAWEFDRKGGKYAIEAAEMLEREGFNFTIAFVGNEALWNRDEIKRVINRPWFKKQEFVDDINYLYCNARCFLHISLAEGCSYALQESIYSGIPVICSDIDENSFAFDFPTVIVVESKNSTSVKNAMKSVLLNKNIMSSEKIDKSRYLIEKDFSLESWANNILSFYQSLEK